MRLIGTAAWAWLIMIGIWMLTPYGPVCLSCGMSLQVGVAVITVLLGVGGLASRYMPSANSAS